MKIINNIKWYKPREIAELDLLDGLEGKAKYWTVLRMIRNGEVKHVILNPNSKTPYKLVSETEINRYNEEFRKRFA